MTSVKTVENDYTDSVDEEEVVNENKDSSVDPDSQKIPVNSLPV